MYSKFVYSNQISGKKIAFSIIGKQPPTKNLIFLLLTRLPIIYVRDADSSVIKEPNIISKRAQPQIKFDTKHPTKTPTIASGKKSGKIVKPSASLT